MALKVARCIVEYLECRPQGVVFPTTKVQSSVSIQAKSKVKRSKTNY